MKEKIKRCLLAGYDIDLINKKELEDYWEYIDSIEDTPIISKLYVNNELQYDLTPKEDKKIKELELDDWWEITSSEDCKPEMLEIIFNKNAKAFSSKINELVRKVNGEDNEN